MGQKIDARYIAESLGNPTRSGNGYMVRCPAHEDKKPSLYVADGRDNSIVLKCHAGCTYQAVRDVLQSRDLWSAKNVAQRSKEAGKKDDCAAVTPVPDDAPALDFKKVLGWEPTTHYRYLNADGHFMFIVARRDQQGGKDIRPVVLARNKTTGALLWTARGLPRPRPLYGLHDLAKRPEARVIMVEGEKTANAAAKLFPNHVAMTWAGGAKGIEYPDFAPLKGRDVTLWPDNDEPGKLAMSTLAVILKASGAKSAKQVSLPDVLPPKWDLADPVPEGLDVKALLEEATELRTGLRVHVLSATALAKLPITPREYIVEPFLPTASMSMVFAERGIGKTWLVLSLCVAVSRGDDFLGFNVPKVRRVLYIDGEMALFDLKSRVVALDDGQNENLFLLPSERLFRLDRPLNINTPEDQARIVEVTEQLRLEGNLPDLIVFDNLSSLSAGTDENDNSALDALLQWLVSLRHRQFAILLVHHAGKSGDQRGASRREDLLDTSIKLSRPKPQKRRKGGDDDDDEPDEEPDGAFFELESVKTRGIRPKPYKFMMRLVDGENRKLVWMTETGSGATALDKTLKVIATEFPRSQLDLGITLRVTKGRVSQICAELRDRGFLEDGLSASRKGREHLVKLWPELERVFMRQETIPFPRPKLPDDDVI